MKKKLIAIVAVALLLTGCNAADTRHQEELKEIARLAELSEKCQEAGGRYVLTVPPGYTSASYWCLWDQEREGGEW